MDIVWHFFFEMPVVLVDVYVVKADPMMISEPLAQVVVFFASNCYKCRFHINIVHVYLLLY